MKIPTNRKGRPLPIDKVTGDVSRPVLTTLYLDVEDGPEGYGWLYATDSYKLARVRAETEPGDVTGMVDREAYREACRPASKPENRLEGRRVRLTRTMARVFRRDGAVVMRRNPVKDATYPNVRDLIDGAITQEPKASVSFNARYLYDLAQALGDDQVTITVATGELRPVLVRPWDAHNPNVGLLMPVRVRKADA